jgi:FkbM family methyltransferase
MNSQARSPAPQAPTNPAPDSPAVAELASGVQKLGQAMEATIQNITTQVEVNTAVTAKLLSLENRIRGMEAQMSQALKTPANFSVYLGDNLALTRVLDRYKMYVDTTDVQIASHLMADGYWEMWITKIFQQLVKPDMTVLDIGANFGYYTLLAADLVGPQGCVYAIEADPRNYSILEKNVSVNGFTDRTQTYQVAALNERKEVQLHMCPNYLGGNTLFPSREKSGTGKNVAVQAVPVDELIKSRVDFAKIDAEGSEPLILEGMAGIITRSPHIQILLEFAPTMLARTGVKPEDFLQRMRDLGFSIYVATDQSTLEPYDDSTILATPLSMLLLKKG